MTHKRYEIETIEQLVNIVNAENIERLSVDLKHWLYVTNQIYTELKEKNPEYQNILNSEIAKTKFIWIDDGKHEIEKIRLHNAETGEITEW